MFGGGGGSVCGGLSCFVLWVAFRFDFFVCVCVGGWVFFFFSPFFLIQAMYSYSIKGTM